MKPFTVDYNLSHSRITPRRAGGSYVNFLKVNRRRGSARGLGPDRTNSRKLRFLGP